MDASLRLVHSGHMAIFDPNLIAALVLRKALVRAGRFQRAFAKEMRLAHRPAPAAHKTRKFYRDRLPPLTPEELAQIGRLDGLLDG